MVLRHTIPPRSRQMEGDGRGVEGDSPDHPPTAETDRAEDKAADGGAKRPEKPPETVLDTGKSDLDRRQNVEREKTYGRDQGGNQQGNQRGIGNPGDR